MYIDDIKLFDKKDKESVCLMQPIRTYIQDIRMECDILISESE